jgi:hypothetical protein
MVLEMQARARGAAARRGFLRSKRAVTAAAAAARGAAARRTFLRAKRAVTTVQRFARGWCVRRSLRRSQEAAVVVQSATRGWLTRLRAKRNAAATIMQARCRGHATRRKAAPRLGELRALVAASRWDCLHTVYPVHKLNSS